MWPARTRNPSSQQLVLIDHVHVANTHMGTLAQACQVAAAGFVRPSACCEHSHATASSDDVRQSTACTCKNCAPWSFTRRHVQHMTAALYLGRVLSVPVCSCLGLLVDSLRSQLSWFCHPPAAKVGRVGLLSLEPGGFFGSLQSDAHSPNV